LLDGYFAEELEFDTPKRGYKYLVLEVRIKGTEEDGHLYSSTNFSGEDAKTGAGYDSEFFISVDVLGSDTLSRGEYVIGTVVLEVQETARQIIVKYDPNQITLDDLYWRFP
jgi:hypothetical protein